LSATSKPTHLIERAAARMNVPWGEALARLAPAAATIGAAEVKLGPRPEPADLPAADTRVTAPIAADVLARAGLIDRTDRYTRITEEFRIVQSKVLREAFAGNGIAAKAPANLILVTSALPGEGKSFVALNLAAGIARQGDRRVLLVDTDIKRDTLSQLMGVSQAPGLLDLVRSGGRQIEELIIPTATENLDVLPLGTGAGESAELFASNRMTELLGDLSRRYADRPIIIDSSPCLSSSNPHILAPAVGQIILVVAASSTHLGDVETALELVQNCPSVSLLLNKIAAWNQHSFGSYSAHYPSPST
jgi:protein-tyrosine kinase